MICQQLIYEIIHVKFMLSDSAKNNDQKELELAVSDKSKIKAVHMVFDVI